jgi:hypothetical protein
MFEVNIVAATDVAVSYMRAHIPDAAPFKNTTSVCVKRTMPIPRINEHIVLDKNLVFRIRDVMYIPNNDVNKLEIRVLVEAA